MGIKTTKPDWKVWRFDQMATNVNDRIDNPSESGMEHYVGLEHLDADSLKIRRWGSPDDVGATKLMFKKGDIIFGRRRAYQRKLGVAEFDGICSAHAMVLRAKPEVVLPDFLPFFMQSDLFMNRAVEISVGSLSPTINWKTMAVQKFALPTLDQQKGFIAVLSEVENCIFQLENLLAEQEKLKIAAIHSRLINAKSTTTVALNALLSLSKGGVWGLDPDHGEVNVAVIRSTDISNDGSVNFSTAAIRGVKESEIKDRKLRTGDVVIEKSGGGPDQPVGRVVFIQGTPRPCICSNFMTLLRFNGERCNPEFMFYLLWFWHVIGKTKHFQNQTTGIRNLSLPKYLESEVRLPHEQYQRETVVILNELRNRIAHTSDRLVELKAIKKELLNRASVDV